MARDMTYTGKQDVRKSKQNYYLTFDRRCELTE